MHNAALLNNEGGLSYFEIGAWWIVSIQDGHRVEVCNALLGCPCMQPLRRPWCPWGIWQQKIPGSGKLTYIAKLALFEIEIKAEVEDLMNATVFISAILHVQSWLGKRRFRHFDEAFVKFHRLVLSWRLPNQPSSGCKVSLYSLYGLRHRMLT